mmetsp:Transcript_26578/g.47292  ORF Transcript_26578/g.47292 Transcript_26578/m.47292 type:complete len:335 (-) Transcript_26578:74-1078(-)
MSETNRSGALEVFRLLDVSPSAAPVLSHVASLLAHQSWQSIAAKGLLAASYGAGLFIAVRYLKRRVTTKLAELHELQRMHSGLWELLSDWKNIGDEEGAPEELLSKGLETDDGTILYKSSSGTIIQFRRSYGKGAAIPGLWEWSMDGVKWIPTSDLKELGRMSACTCLHAECSPNKADRIFILRLEVERHIRHAVNHQNSRPPDGYAAVTWPPPLDPSSSDRSMLHVPQEYLCPITFSLLTEPVITPSGITYNRPALMQWIASHHTDPATGNVLDPSWLVPNLVMRDIIQKWLVEQPTVIMEHQLDCMASPGAASFTSPSAVHQHRRYRTISHA